MNIHYDISSETGLMNLKFKNTILDPLGYNKEIFEKYIIPMLSMNDKFVLTGSLSLKLMGFEPMDKVGDFDFGLLDTFTEEEYVALKNFFQLSDLSNGYGQESESPKTPKFNSKDHMWQFSKQWSEPTDDELQKELFFKMDIFNDEILRKRDIITIYYDEFPVRVVHPSVTLSYRMRYALDIRSSQTFKYWEKMKVFMDNAKSYYNQIRSIAKMIARVHEHNANIEGDKKKGIAQIDLMLTDNLNFSTFMYHSPDFTQAESKYKGLYRNILQQNILSNSRRETSKLTDKGEIEEYQSYVLRLNQGVVQVTKSFMGKKGNIITTTSLLHDQDKFVTNTPEVIAELAFGPDVPISEIMTFEDIWRHTTDSKFIHHDKLNAILKDFKVRLLGTKVPFPTECIEQYPNIFTS